MGDACRGNARAPAVSAYVSVTSCAPPPPHLHSATPTCPSPPPHSYPFLLDPRAKSNLLHIEARFQMEQV